jgi:GNAT superfamily N-acetyltransferase
VKPILRPMTLNDIPDGLELCRESGWNQTANDWELLISLAPDGALAAEADGAVVGTVINVPYRPAFDWIAMMLVRESLRGQGIGRLLMNAALAMSPSTVRLDATDAGRRLYLTLGFEDEYTLSRWRCPAPVAPEMNSPTTAIAETDWNEIATMDTRSFGADRLKVLHGCRQSASEYAWALRGDGGLVGYVFGRHGHNSEHIGPLIATTVAVAAPLLASCLASAPRRPMTIDVPDAQEAFGHTLESLGFARQRRFTRMVRGKRAWASLRPDVFAAAGPELA